MSKQLGGIEQLNRLPSAVFIVDIHHEHLALAESRKLHVKTFGMVDTNSDPTLVDFAVPQQ
jgi:small subunit ribosomal protein S2